MCTHQEYIEHVADLALSLLPAVDRAKCAAHITYGAGRPGLRGVTYFDVWKGSDEDAPVPFVEICAFGEEDPVQLAGTTVHELAHVLAGHKAGHGPKWKKACERLGLRTAKAAGNVYRMAQFAPRLRYSIAGLTSPTDGKPVGAHHRGNVVPINPKPCPMGVGTRGGVSRGKGSGSRMRKWVCACAPKPVVVRVASDDFQAHCDHCGSAFTRG